MGRYILKKKIAIFVNNNDKIGLGHIYRCINFVNIFKKKLKIFFFVDKKSSILKYPSYIFNKKQKNLIQIDELLKKNNCKNILFDIDNKLNSKKELSNIYNFFIQKNYKTICWDNLKNINTKFSFIYRPYPKKTFNNSKIYKQKKIIGTEFFFYKIKKKFVYRKKIQRIAIQLGGTKNLETIKILINYFKKYKDIKIYFFVKNTIEINFLNSCKIKNLKIFKNSNFSNYADCLDFLISSGGMTKYESSSINLPSLAICLDQFQFNLNKNLNMKYGFLISKKKDAIKKLNLIIADEEVRLKLYKNAKKNFNNFTNDSIKKIYGILK